MKIRYTLFCFFLPIFLFANNEIIQIYDQQLNLEGVDFYFEKIIDARKNKGAIGFVQKGLNNKRSLAVFRDGIETEFLRLFIHNFPKKEKAIPLILKINQFVIYEETYTMDEIAIAKMDFTIFQKDGDDFVTLFESGNVQKKYGIDVTNLHSKNILNGITRFFQEFIKAKRNESLLKIVVDETILLETKMIDENFFITTKPLEKVEKEKIEIPSELLKTGVFIYCPPSEKKSPIRILIDREERCIINPNEYMHIPVLNQNQQIEICLESEGKERCNMIMAGSDTVMSFGAIYHKRKGAKLIMMNIDDFGLMIHGVNEGIIKLVETK